MCAAICVCRRQEDENMSEVLSIRRQGDVALLTLHRPAARNALNAKLAQAICDAIPRCRDAGAIVITGADPAFCAGLDLRDLGVEHLSDLPRAFDAVRASEVPTIAAVNGPAVTGGFELALACDFVIGSEHATFADTHVRVGVFPGPVLVELPRRIGMARAREMSLTGNFVNAKRALEFGILNQVVPHQELIPTALELASDIADQDQELIAHIRRAWDATADLPYGDAMATRKEHALASGSGRRRGQDIAARREQVVRRAKKQRR